MYAYIKEKKDKITRIVDNRKINTNNFKLIFFIISKKTKHEHNNTDIIKQKKPTAEIIYNFFSIVYFL